MPKIALHLFSVGVTSKNGIITTMENDKVILKINDKIVADGKYVGGLFWLNASMPNKITNNVAETKCHMLQKLNIYIPTYVDFRREYYGISI
jgi:hypothetical protein